MIDKKAHAVLGFIERGIVSKARERDDSKYGKSMAGVLYQRNAEYPKEGDYNVEGLSDCAILG